jgi:hypothetical protein
MAVARLEDRLRPRSLGPCLVHLLGRDRDAVVGDHRGAVVEAMHAVPERTLAGAMIDDGPMGLGIDGDRAAALQLTVPAFSECG